MTESSLIAAEVTSACRCCYEKTNPGDQFCQACGFPLTGSAAEQQIFIYRRGFKKVDLSELDKKIKKAGNSLYVLAGMFFLYALIYFFFNRTAVTALSVLITNVIISVVFLFLGIWSAKKPVASIISGIVLYALIQLMAAFEDPSALVKGFIFKIIIIGYLIKGLVSALEAEKIKKQHNI